MASRFKITNLICPNCGQRATANWEVSLTCQTRRLRDLRDFSRGFLSIDGGKPGDPHFECKKCRVRALEKDADTSQDEASSQPIAPH